MNDVSKNKKDSILKSLAIAGFVGIIILISWLSIQFVSIVPEAFSSLASLIEGLNQHQEAALEENDMTQFNVTSNASIVNAGGSVVISWETTKVPGSYTFSYECLEGVAIDIANDDGLQSIACDTNYNLGNTDSLSLTIDSEKERFIDINYTVSFLATNDTEPRASATASLTVINDQINSVFVSDNVNETEIVEEEVIDEVETVVGTTPGEEIVYEQKFVYTIPTSDPNGITDLGTKFLNTGKIIGNVFIAGKLKQDDNGAVQFEVKNFGTKTSEEWTFSVSLPDGGNYTSTEQKPLKPNERAVLTIGFPATDDTRHTFEVEIEESTDVNSLNNKFEKAVTLI